MKTRLLLLPVLLWCASFLSSCERESVMNGNPTPVPFMVTGSIQNDTTLAIPSSARVYAVWIVPSDTPDYLYVYGNSLVDPVDNTFNLTFSAPPPGEALNNNEVGVAYLMLTDRNLAEGPVTDSVLGLRILPGGFYGMVNDQAIVYVNGNPEVTNDDRPWVSNFGFERGYNLAKSWYNGDTVGGTFDGFRPDSGAVQLSISRNPAAFTFPNWY